MTFSTNRRIALSSVIACLALILFTGQLAAASQARSTDHATQTIEDPSGRAMLSFYQALSRASQGEFVARIVHYGDSHVAADILTGALRRELQAFFGDAGGGFVLPGCQWYSRTGVSSRASAGWQVDGLTQASLAADGGFGIAGVCSSTSASGEWMTVSATASYFDIYFLKQPGGGAIDVLLDGVEQKRNVSLASRIAEPGYVQVVADGGRTHTIEICTMSLGLTRIFGIAVERNSPGVVYDALGINGARASRPLRWDWKLLASNLERRDPDLIIVAYGSNEVGDADLDLEEYQKHFSTLLERFRRAAPRASILVIAPPDRAVRVGRRWQIINRMPALVEAQRRAAFKAGAAFYDLFAAMGGAGSIERWATQAPALAQADRVHLTATGYRMVAGWIFSSLVTGFLQSVSS
jgi:lysophospholipase L1-like esterase